MLCFVGGYIVDNSDDKKAKRKKVLKFVLLVILLAVLQIILLFGGLWFNISRSFKKHDEEMERFRNRTIDTVEDEEPFDYTAWLEDDDEHYEGLIQVGDDIYYVEIDTTNFNTEEQHAKSNKVMFKINGADEYKLDVSFEIINTRMVYDIIRDKALDDEENVESYNGWKYYKTEMGYTCYYEFNRFDDDYAIAVIYIDEEDVEEDKEDEVGDVILKLLEGIEIDYKYKYDRDKGKLPTGYERYSGDVPYYEPEEDEDEDRDTAYFDER